MLKKRIIPSLLLKDNRMVKSVQFGGFRDTGHPLTAARIYDAQRVDELLILDIFASRDRRGMHSEIVAQISEECFMPLCVGGGIRSVEDIRILLSKGADKVLINTGAVECEGLIGEAARAFGSSTVVVSVDVRRRPASRLKSEMEGEYEVFVRGGTESTGLDPVSWSKTAQELGAGEIFLTSIDRDGTMSGLDIALIRSVADSVSIPVIASGGVGTLDDFRIGMEEGGASAVSAASIFHFTDQSPIKVRKYLVDRGVNVRA